VSAPGIADAPAPPQAEHRMTDPIALTAARTPLERLREDPALAALREAA
jgi:hypothetical protein